MLVIENKAFKAQLRKGDDEVEQELGNEIPLSDISRWAGISEEPVTIDNVEKYMRVGKLFFNSNK